MSRAVVWSKNNCIYCSLFYNWTWGSNIKRQALYGVIFNIWIKSGFGALNEIKNSILALTLIVIGIQTIFSSFMLSILGIKEK